MQGESGSVLSPLSQLTKGSSLGEQQVVHDAPGSSLQEESTMLQRSLQVPNLARCQENAGEANLHNTCSVETAGENAANTTLNQTVVTVGTKNQVQSPTGEHCCCSNSLYVAPSAGDQGAVGAGPGTAGPHHSKNKNRRHSEYIGAQPGQGSLLQATV